MQTQDERDWDLDRENTRYDRNNPKWGNGPDDFEDEEDEEDEDD